MHIGRHLTNDSAYLPQIFYHSFQLSGLLGHLLDHGILHCVIVADAVVLLLKVGDPLLSVLPAFISGDAITLKESLTLGILLLFADRIFL